MGTWLIMLGCNLIIPAIMLLAGRLMHKTPPKKINWIIGYRTSMSMKNEDTWAYAHKMAGAFMWKWGWVTLAGTAVAMLLILRGSVDIISTIGCVVMIAQLVPVIAVIPYTEKHLRSTFDQDGNRRTNAQ